MASRTVGTLEGAGTLSFGGGDPFGIRYKIVGTHNVARHTLSAEGALWGPNYQLMRASGRSDVVLTTDDGQPLNIAIVAKGRGEASIFVNSDVAQFRDAFRRQ